MGLGFYTSPEALYGPSKHPSKPKAMTSALVIPIENILQLQSKTLVRVTSFDAQFMNEWIVGLHKIVLHLLPPRNWMLAKLAQLQPANTLQCGVTYFT
jgi:hypothetical protein